MSTSMVYRKTGFMVLAACALLSLSACHMFGDDDEKPVPPPEARTTALNTDASAATTSDLTKPPGDALAPVQAPTLSVGSPSIEAAKGLNTQKLFAEKIRDDDDRMARLEAAVQKMRDELDAIKPSITRLMSVEGDIHQLIDGLNQVVNNGGAPDEISAAQLQNDDAAINRALDVPANDQPVRIFPPQEATPLPAAPPPVVAATPPTPPAALAPPPLPPAATAEQSPASGMMQPRVMSLRMADDGSKTRIVLETSTEMSYTADLDNSEHILTLLFNTGSSADLSAFPIRSKLVKSATATPQVNGGFVIAFTLNGDSKILNEGKIGPGAENARHRLYIDLAN